MPATRTTSAASVISAWLAGRKATTALAYRGDLRAFAAWACLAPEDAVAALFALDAGRANALALAYVAAMKDAGLSSATVSRRLAALRSLVRVARMVGAITWSIEVSALGMIT